MVSYTAQLTSDPGVGTCERGSRGGVLQFATGLDAEFEFVPAALLPAAQPPEDAPVQQQHDGTRQEEGAHGRVHHVVTVLQFTLARVALLHVIDPEHHRRRHGQRQQPGGAQEHDLSLVHLPAVVVQGNGHRDEPAAGRLVKTRLL